MAAQDPKNLLAQVDWQTREKFLQMATGFERATGLALRVRSGRRTCAEQADLYGIGRRYHLDAKPVTYARGCSSWHVLGRAVDADPVDRSSGQVMGDCRNYTAAGELWERLGGVWGGRFGGFGPCGDAGHFEWHPGVKMADLCPNPDACETAEAGIVTSKPFSWWNVALSAGVLAVGVALGYRVLS